jgi:thiol-disulfide isomerase/thioredoxin
MITAEFLRGKFALGLSYSAYTDSGTPDQQEKWRRVYEQVSLTQAQKTLVSSFTRRVNLLVSSGLWCGDCAHQCPMLARIAEANPASTEHPDSSGIALRFLNRDEHMDLANQMRICDGNRVPTVLFLAEDFEFISLLGDKTLTRLRAKAAKTFGASCPLPGAALPPDEAAATLQEWLNEVERVHLTLRLSTRLRQRHND